MLYIKKMKPPTVVTDRLNKEKRSEEWRQIREEDTKAIRAHFDTLNKSDIRKALVEEQHGLCAYCMRRIVDDGNVMAIEHWFPLSQSKKLALEYSNMLGVCQGGRKGEGDRQRILCCDASKDENKITIDPQNEFHMKDIAYKKSGTIYTLSGNEDLENDINFKLCLNGWIDRKGNQIDTFTEIVKGRRDAIAWCEAFYTALNRYEKCTSTMIHKKIEEIENADIMPEFAGVKLYFLRKKYRQLRAREGKKTG